MAPKLPQLKGRKSAFSVVTRRENDKVKDGDGELVMRKSWWCRHLDSPPLPVEEVGKAARTGENKQAASFSGVCCNPSNGVHDDHNGVHDDHNGVHDDHNGDHNAKQNRGEQTSGLLLRGVLQPLQWSP